MKNDVKFNIYYSDKDIPDEVVTIALHRISAVSKNVRTDEIEFWVTILNEPSDTHYIRRINGKTFDELSLLIQNADKNIIDLT